MKKRTVKSKSPAKEPEWEEIWDARETALSTILGKPSKSVFHSMIPFGFGGQADVVPFPKFVPGMTYVTAEMTGQDAGQKRNKLGNYELLICSRKVAPTFAALVANLAQFTCEAKIQPGDTINVDGAFGKLSAIKNLLFWHPFEKPYAFNLFGQKCGLLLCLGITDEELKFSKKFGPKKLVAELKEAGVFPYTVPRRKSAV